MMRSDQDSEAFAWIWLPEETQPVIAGKLTSDNGKIQFNYGKNYLKRVHNSNAAIAVYEPELPLKSGVLPLPDGLSMPDCIRDTAPDAWGRRVYLRRKSPYVSSLEVLTHSAKVAIHCGDIRASLKKQGETIGVNDCL